MGLIREIFAENIYDIQRDNINLNGVVIDIGAHIGVFSIFAATMAKNATVYCFEPEPDNFQMLVKNIALNKLQDRILPFNIAVSNVSAMRKLIRSSSSLSAHSFFPRKILAEETKDSIDVTCISLSDIFQKYKIEKCDFLKLDCEGEEYNILLNAPDEILDKTARIALEYHDGLTDSSSRELADFLKRKHFKVAVKKERSFPTFEVGFLYAAR